VFDNKDSDIFILKNKAVEVQAFIDNIEEKKENIGGQIENISSISEEFHYYLIDIL